MTQFAPAEVFQVVDENARIERFAPEIAVPGALAVAGGEYFFTPAVVNFKLMQVFDDVGIIYPEYVIQPVIIRGKGIGKIDFITVQVGLIDHDDFEGITHHAGSKIGPEDIGRGAVRADQAISF